LVTVIQNITNSPWGNSDYLICERSTRRAIAVDPWDMEQLNTLAAKVDCEISSIFITHTHRDHVEGTHSYLSSLRSHKNPIPIFCHQMVTDQVLGAQPSKGGDVFMAGSIQVIETPGHRPEHMSLLIEDAFWRRNEAPMGLTKVSSTSDPIFIAGDCLFDSGIGNCKNGGDVSTLFETATETLMRLPEGALVFPGHDYRQRNLEFANSIEPNNTDIANAQDANSLTPSTIREQMLVNPFFRVNQISITNRLSELGLPHDTPCERFSSLRKLRDSW
jgi:hydroxyacylglutathione hydrolase